MDMLQNTQPLPCPCESPEPLGTSPVNDESLKQEPEKPEEPSAPVFIAPDDLPIRPMKLEQQRQLMMLRDSDENIKTMLRVTPVKMPVAPDAPGGATSPGKEEELRPEDAEEAAPLMPFFPPEIIAALFSSQVQARSSALEGIVAELKEHAADEITGNLFLALCVVMRRAFKDKILKVFLGGAQLLALFLDAPALQPRHFLSPQFRPVLHELCLRVGDVISDRACRLLLQLCSARPELKDEFAREIFDRLVLASKSVAGGVNSKAGGGGGSPLIGAGRGIGGSGAGEKNFKTRAGSGGGPYLETKLSNSGRALGVPGKGSGDGGVVANGGGLGGAAAHQHKTTAQLLHLLASLLAAHSIIQPLSPQGLPLMPLLNVLGGCFQSPSGDTRAAAVRVTALLLMQVPHPATQAKVNQFVETLRPKQKEMVMADLERLRQLGNEPPGDFSGGSGPIQFRAGGPHFPVSTPPPRSTRGSTPVSTGGGTGGGKNAKKAVQGRNKPQEGRRSDVPSRTGVDSETAKKDENESLGPACEFCLKRSPEFASRSAGGGLERHLLLKCPMLAPCPYCRNIIEVSNLPNHVLAECSETKAYVRCDNCRIVLLATQLPSHKQYACKAPPDPDSQHCYFCRELIPPSVTAWREHLLFDCPANPRRPPHGT